jgi:hypothetical protein
MKFKAIIVNRALLKILVKFNILYLYGSTVNAYKILVRKPEWSRDSSLV